MRERTGGRTGVYLVCAALGAGLLLYSQTLAFAWDEGFHLLAAQLIKAGKTPYLDFLFPQPPLNAYWVAWWMRLFGESWRTAQALSAFQSAAAVALVGDYLLRRFPDPEWRVPAAAAAVILFGLNTAVVEFGTEGQAYGVCLLLVVLAFRFGVAALGSPGCILAFAAGCCASGAAACSLLTAPVAPVLLFWLMFSHIAGKRWWKFLAFAAGTVVPWIPVIVLFAKAPPVVWFGLAGYNILYRRNGWGDPTEHDMDVLLAWIDSAQGLLLVGLAIGGLVYVVKKSGWERHIRAECHLCAWLVLAECAHLSVGRPTFARYFLLTVPFLGILAAAGLYAVAQQFGGGARWPLTITAVLMSLGLAKSLYEERNAFLWEDFEEIARKVREVTPKNGTVLADEHVYFLDGIRPPSGMELDYSHRLLISDVFAKQLHVVLRPELNRRIQAGVYDTVATCELEKADAIGIPSLYLRYADIGDCRVFWDFRK